eukprot:CAMPEP_0172496204 /NCGR_PEP_ID=MMETSP1066-20121228/83321_1 /TAXON_ID=671091 /ORGANISM="Coscinodiscus wailesii, Strain CCMP2513" /LENGTH=299 /DNA_ID=CAMNT_0013268383 /DNA_START=76 /DNA_END=975 /DNA_ORIENTATION=+
MSDAATKENDIRDDDDTTTEDEQSAHVVCETSEGPIEMYFERNWSPNGYDRVVTLFEAGYYDDTHFYRVVPKFLVQFGISYTTDPDLKKLGWVPIPDDPKLHPPIPFEPGTISFAGSGPNSRSSQIFISYGSAPSLGRELWETPVGYVSSGMEYAERFYSGYGDGPPFGKGPGQGKIQNEGRAYIEREFPLLSSMGKCTTERYRTGVEGGDDALGTPIPSQEEHEEEIMDLKEEEQGLLPVPANKQQIRKAKVVSEPSASNKGQNMDPTMSFSIVMVMFFAVLFVYVYRTNRPKEKKSQ